MSRETKRFHPNYSIGKIIDLSPAFFIEKSIKNIFLDVDNTLTTHNEKKPYDGVCDWITHMKDSGFNLFVLSNNSFDRVEKFSKEIGLPFLSKASKPLTRKIKKHMLENGLKQKETCIIGDQIFTDILCGKRLKIKTILITKITPEKGRLFRIKRRAEKIVLRNYDFNSGENK